jgi:RsmE family RNA methyltransferase
VEAAKQSARAWVPTVESPQTFARAVARIGEFSAAAIAHPDSSATPFTDFLRNHGEGSTLLVFVGPEGGWSEAECRVAIAAGAVSIRLSPTVLRSETAAVTVCAAAALYSARQAPTPLSVGAELAAGIERMRPGLQCDSVCARNPSPLKGRGQGEG